MKALPLLIRKLWPRLKFFKSRSNVKVKVTRSKILVPTERSCDKECTYVIWKPYLFWLGSYGQGLKFFKSRSNVSRVKVTRSKILVPTERSCDKECTYVIWKPYLFWLGSYGQGSSFLKVGQTSRSRLQGQKFWYPSKGLVTRNVHM